MEGTVGAVTAEQLGPAGFEYQRFREFMTREVLAAIAGHFGVPVVLISGDDRIVVEARSLLGDIEGAVVKWAYGFHSARTLTPDAAYDRSSPPTNRTWSRDRAVTRPTRTTTGVSEP